MGGKKKKPLRSLAKKRREFVRKESEERAAKPKTIGSIHEPAITREELLEELGKMRAITPYTVSSRWGLRLSVAKHLLKKLHSSGDLQLVGGGGRLRIYCLPPRS